MKKLPHIVLLASFILILNSCRKEVNFSSQETNLVGKWYSSYTNYSTGSYFEFSTNDHIHYVDNGNALSQEDDFSISGSAKMHNNIIKLGRYRFRIEEYAIPCVTSISRGGYIIPVTQRIKLKIGRVFTNDWGKVETQEYYKE